MLPVLFTIFSQPISSFGLFLLLALVSASFTIWRIARVYELNEEKVIDLLLLTFVGGLIFSRIYFIIFHPEQFNSIAKIFLVNRYPGLSFWGGFLGGILALWVFSKRLKMHLWQSLDFAIVGLFLGISFGSLGCLLGSCQYGLPSSSIFAVSQVGLIGKRFPLQIIEGLIFLTLFLYLWKKILRFHFNGQIASYGLIWLGTVKFFLEFFRGDKQFIFFNLSFGTIFSLLTIILGITIFYRQSRRSFKTDLKLFPLFFTNQYKRKMIISKVYRYWYNAMINFKISLQRMRKTLFKSLNVKSNPTKGF